MIQLPTNHAGYVIQEYKKHGDDQIASWKAITEPKEDDTSVRADLTIKQLEQPSAELRFFGAITPKVKKKAGLW